MAARIESQVQRNVMMEILRVEMEESLLARLASGVILVCFVHLNFKFYLRLLMLIYTHGLLN